MSTQPRSATPRPVFVRFAAYLIALATATALPPAPAPAQDAAPAEEGLLTLIATVSRRESALALRAVLSDAGIRSTIRVPAPHRADVLVFPEDADRARALAATFPGN